MQPQGSSMGAYFGFLAYSEGEGFVGSSEAHSTSAMWMTSAGREHGCGVGIIAVVVVLGVVVVVVPVGWHTSMLSSFMPSFAGGWSCSSILFSYSYSIRLACL